MNEFRDPEGVFNNIHFWCSLEHSAKVDAGENEGYITYNWAVKVIQNGSIHNNVMKIISTTRSYPRNGSLIQLIFIVPNYFTFDFVVKIDDPHKEIGSFIKQPEGCPYFWLGDHGNIKINPEMSLRCLKTVDDYSIDDIEELLLLHKLTRNP